MEGSKKFAKDVMLAAGVPTARCAVVHTPDEARAKIKEFGIPVVLKADGLAAGKGVSVCMNQAEVEEAIDTMLITKSFGESASEVLIEEFMTGEEASILAFVDGEHIVPLASAQDHKRLLNNDKGPNTGGMGSYSPAPCVTEDMLAVVQNRILEPVVAELRKRGIVYKGILYAGIMLTPTGPRVVEFNCRFGDPETQSILPRMDFNMVEAMNACIDGTLSKEMIKWKPGNCVCVVMVAGGYPGKYDKDNPIEGIAAAEQDEDVDVFHAGTALKNGTVVTAGGRVLGVTAHGPDLRETVAKAYRAILKIKYDGAEYRTDIAHRALKLEKE
jgi:phosphoribosylamine--glycine ligase